MSSVNNITFSYQQYKSYVKNNKESRLSNRSYNMDLGSGQGEDRLLGSTVYRDSKTDASYELKAA
ncbi:MAG: hypothetical protein K2N44_06240 [Lachnospiraceae bacterium]|nr:hypothetical protein [Lachnospiraceae bacterium]